MYVQQSFVTCFLYIVAIDVACYYNHLLHFAVWNTTLKNLVSSLCVIVTV